MNSKLFLIKDKGNRVNLNQVTLAVKDIQAASEFYLKLGFIKIVDTPHYLRFESPMGDATFSLALDTDMVAGNTIIYFEHEQLDQWIEEIKPKGIKLDVEPKDQRYLWREASLRDPSGNKIKLYWAGENRRNPPWRVSTND